MTRTGRASFTQERFYFLNELQPGNPAYVVAFALRMDGPLDQPRLAAAIHRVTETHDVLRTRLAVVDGELRQEVHAAAPEIELTSRAAADRDTRDRYLRELVATEARRPFALDSGQVLRAHIVSWDADHHALVVLVHHIACDGWGVGLLLDAIAEQYNTGTSATPEITYLEYAKAQRETWSRHANGLDYWRDALAGAPQLALHTDHPRPSVLSCQGTVLRRPVDPAMIQRLTAWAKQRRVTLFAVALAAYAQVLGRHARQQEVVIGVPVANRIEEAEERLLGCLVNTLPIRVDLSGQPGFADLVTRTWRTALAALSHQDVPFEQVVRALGEQRELSHAPLCQTMLTVQNFTFTVPEFAGLTAAEVDVEIEAAKFDVGMTLDVSTGSPFLRAEFSTELFDEATVDGMLTHFHTLLASITSDVDGEPDMVGQRERDLVTEGWNPPVHHTPPDHPSVLRSFQEHAERSPDAVAVVHRGEAITYRALDRWSSGIAAALVDAGVGEGDRVGLLLERSPAVLAAILGVWRTGAVYVPLDPAYPSHRLTLIVDSAQPVIVIDESATAEKARRLAEPRGIALLDAHTVDRSASVPTLLPAPDQLAYLIYTSGSTGVPKGVMVRHRGLDALCDPRPASLDVDATDRWLCAHSFSFDVSVWEMWGALTTGARLVIADQADLVDPQRLARLINAERITVLSLTPGALYRVLPPLFDSLDGDRERATVRYVVLAGEALRWSRVASLVDPERLPAVFVNMYGITEGTIHVTIVQVPAADLHRVREGDIGVPLPSARCYVLDELGRPTGVNVPGELYVGGELVAAGYVGAPELTEARFGPDPDAPGNRYRTGDIVRWGHDGTLSYLGREDAQVKVRGYRVELAEIEAAFQRQHGVRSCVAAVDGDELVVFLCRDSDTETERELRALVRDELPAYMVPSRIVVVPEIPLNANGKVDTRRLLAEREPAAPAVTEPAAGSVAARIRLIWADVLQRPGLEPTENFFDAGGHSFALITVQQRMAQAGLAVSVTDLFRFGTVAACAAHFERASTPPEDDNATALVAQRKRGRDNLARRRRAGRGEVNA